MVGISQFRGLKEPIENCYGHYIMIIIIIINRLHK